MYRFSTRSYNNLRDVHPCLVAVMVRALTLSKYDFTIIEGIRSYERQIELKNQGKSQTTNSKHLLQKDGFGHAVDIAAWTLGNEVRKPEIIWELPYYAEINKAVQKAAYEMNVEITWGGNWKFVDSPHFQFDGLRR